MMRIFIYGWILVYGMDSGVGESIGIITDIIKIEKPYIEPIGIGFNDRYLFLFFL